MGASGMLITHLHHVVLYTCSRNYGVICHTSTSMLMHECMPRDDRRSCCL
jgi:hypothetical protein